MGTSLVTGAQSITLYGTVMGTRLEGRSVVHHIEATRPGGTRVYVEVVSRKRHQGSVRVTWDPQGFVEPHFSFKMPWATVGFAVASVVVVVIGGAFFVG